jgi:predicted ABC-type ATPase
MTQPQLWVISGPNGAGKSTYVQKHFVNRIPVINPDEIAKTVSNHLQAGSTALEQRKSLLAANASFAIETTLTGRSEFRLMQAAKAKGYKINLVYFGLANANQSKRRVATRVDLGGHDVAETDIMRRYPRSVANLITAIPLVDRALITDNSGERLRLLSRIENQQLKSVSKTLPEWAKRVIQSVSR